MSVVFAIGLCGALLFVAGVLHVPITAVAAATAALIAIAVSARFAVRSAQSRLGIADAVLAIPIIVVTFAAAIVPLNDYDGRAFWMLKAKGIAHDHAIDGPFFHGAEVEAPRNDYPLLIPLDTATVMMISGSLDDRVPRFIYIIIFIAFVLMVRAELGAWTAALLAWIPMITIAPDGGAISAYCDVALAAFAAGAFFELIRGTNPWRFGAWIAFVVLTKREGVPLGLALLVIGAFVFRKRFVFALIAPVIAMVTLIVWRSRIPQGDEENLFALFTTLPEKLHRLPYAVIGFVQHLVSPMWGLFWCGAIVALGVLAFRRQWRNFTICASAMAGAFAVCIVAYTITTWIQVDLINSSADRLLMHGVAPALYAISRSTLKK